MKSAQPHAGNMLFPTDPAGYDFFLEINAHVREDALTLVRTGSHSDLFK